MWKNRSVQNTFFCKSLNRSFVAVSFHCRLHLSANQFRDPHPFQARSPWRKPYLFWISFFWRQNPDSFSSHALTVDEEQAIERSYFSLGFRQWRKLLSLPPITLPRTNVGKGEREDLQSGVSVSLLLLTLSRQVSLPFARPTYHSLFLSEFLFLDFGIIRNIR